MSPKFAKGAATFGDKVDIAKDLTVGGNSHIKGNSEVDGNSVVHGNSVVEKNLSVGGDAVIDGDIYGKSFNVGNEKYIDANGINANNHKIRNVADGEIGPNSLDAVNGRQLYNTRKSLDHNIQQVGAGAAALANLHPLEFEHNDKVSVSAAVGNYKDQTVFATGVYVRPDSKSLISLSGTLGYNENMLGVGFSKKFGKHTEFENMTEDQLKDALSKLSEDAKEIKEENKALHKKNKALEAGNKELSEKLVKNSADDLALKASMEKQISGLTVKNADLEKSLSDVTKAYSQLMSKVDGMAAELASLKTAQK